MGIRFIRVVIRFMRLRVRFVTRAIRLSSRTARYSSLAIRFSSGYKAPMEYMMADLEEATGLTARTIRKYMALGLLEPPKRKGLAAVYPESTRVKAIAIVRMRAQGETWDTIGARMRNWSFKRLEEYVVSTEPAAPAPPEPPEPQPPAAAADGAPPSAPALEGEPVTPPPRLPHAGSVPREDLEATTPTDEEWLPDGPRWVLAPLLPGLALWVREDAAPIVRRTAAEIVRRYGSP